MELILKTNNESSIAKIIELAKKLNVSVEKRGMISDVNERQAALKRILEFKGDSTSSFGDPAEWERNERNDRNLPFSR